MRFAVVALLLINYFSVQAQHPTMSMDSLRLATDTLDISQARIDSLQNNFQAKADSLKGLQQKALGDLAQQRQKLSTSIDSLNSLNLPTEGLMQKKDSVEQQIANTTQKFESKLTKLKSDYKTKINDLGLPPQATTKVEKFTRTVDDFKLPSTDLPNVNVPDLNLPDVNLPDVNLDGAKLDNLTVPDANFPSTGVLEDTQQQLKDAVPGTEQLSGIKEVAAVKDLDGAGKLAEEKVGDLSGVKDVAGQTGELGQLNSLAGEDAAKDMLKEQAMEQLPQSPINHFAGKEEVLQKAMEDLSKLKNKYSSLSSLSDIPKKRPNEMRGKPFVERLRPGIALQFFSGHKSILTELNPYVGYRLTGKLTSGMGWNQRVVFNTDKYRFTSGSAVYGPRVFTEYNLWRGFHPRVEMEILNTKVPPALLSAPVDSHHREWVWGMMLGLKKQYSIAKGINGTAMVMFRLFDPKQKSPYKDVVNMRVGVEFNLKKR